MHYGGPSHIDSWDMKPAAPAEIRGGFRPISTSVPGRFVCEHLPLMSQRMHQVAVIRGMHHAMTNHNAAMYEALIGRQPAGGDLELLGVDRPHDFPSIGSVVTYLSATGKIERRDTESLPITHVALPHVMRNVVELAGQTAGFLGGRFDPLQIEGDPNHPDFQVKALSLQSDVSSQRLSARYKLLHSLNQLPPQASGSLDSYRQRAFELLNNACLQRAFDINREAAAVRDHYGRHSLGQSLLLARRLVEAGVRFINVNDGEVNSQNTNWDSHENIFPRHAELLKPADQALSGLIEDLQHRELLDSTLIVATGEFGRTPRINGNAGRDHWPHCYSVVLAGGGVQAGATHGASDAFGEYPVSDPVTPADLAATLLWRFGVDPGQELRDAFGRPFRLSDGRPIKPLFATDS